MSYLLARRTALAEEMAALVPARYVLAILSLGCSVVSIAAIICMFIFFTYAILAGLHYSCRG
jgi:hypothetical protein